MKAIKYNNIVVKPLNVPRDSSDGKGENWEVWDVKEENFLLELFRPEDGDRLLTSFNAPDAELTTDQVQEISHFMALRDSYIYAQRKMSQEETGEASGIVIARNDETHDLRFEMDLKGGTPDVKIWNVIVKTNEAPVAHLIYIKTQKTFLLQQAKNVAVSDRILAQIMDQIKTLRAREEMEESNG